MAEEIKIKDGTPLFQWDINQKLEVEGPACYIDYDDTPEPYRVAVTNSVCPIPDEWLQTAGHKTIWLCSVGNTRRAETLFVRARPMPPDYVYTPTQRITFESLVEAVEEAVEDSEEAAAAANAAAAAATAATQAATAAEASRAAAETGRETAEAARATAEGARASAETARATAEAARAAAETGRNTAEAARSSAEVTRAAKWGTATAEAETVEPTEPAAASVTQDGNGTHFSFEIPKGPKGDTGDVRFATFAVDLSTGQLVMTTPEGFSGISFAIVNNNLEVAIN